VVLVQRSAGVRGCWACRFVGVCVLAQNHLPRWWRPGSVHACCTTTTPRACFDSNSSSGSTRSPTSQTPRLTCCQRGVQPLQADALDDVQRVDHVAQGLAHLAAVSVAHHRVQVHLAGRAPHRASDKALHGEYTRRSTALGGDRASSAGQPGCSAPPDVAKTKLSTTSELAVG
jgi:hypothetical protein